MYNFACIIDRLLSFFLSTFCLDLGDIAWIWALRQNLGQNWPQRRQSPGDGAGEMDVGTDGRRDSPCVRQDLVPLGAAAQKNNS